MTMWISEGVLWLIVLMLALIWYDVMKIRDKVEKTEERLGYMIKDIDKLTEKISDLERKLKK